MTSGFLDYHNIMFIRSQNKDLSLKEIPECNTEGNLIDACYSKKNVPCLQNARNIKQKKCLKPVK